MRAVDELSLVYERSAHPGRHPEEDDRIKAFSGSDPGLSEAGEIPVVVDGRGHAHALSEEVRHREIVPAEEIRRVENHAALKVQRSRARDADPAVRIVPAL